MGDVFEEVHGTFHYGFHRMYERVKQNFYIHKLEKRLREYLHFYQHCRRAEIIRQPLNGPIQPISTPPTPFHTITIDIVTGFPEIHSFNAILAATNKFSKRITVVPGRHDYGASDWADPLLNALTDWGLLVAIISNRDTWWISSL